MALLEPFIGEDADQGEVLLLHVQQLVADLGEDFVGQEVGPRLAEVDLLELLQVVLEGALHIFREQILHRLRPPLLQLDIHRRHDAPELRYRLQSLVDLLNLAELRDHPPQVFLLEVNGFPNPQGVEELLGHLFDGFVVVGILLADGELLHHLLQLFRQPH